MPDRAKTFHFLDIVKFARPNIRMIDATLTAAEIRLRTGKGFMSYGSVPPRIKHIAESGTTEEYLLENFSFYKDEWKNECLRELVRLLDDYLGRKGRWYPGNSRDSQVLGVKFRPVSHGIWFCGTQASAILINPRKRQRLTTDDARYLASAMYYIESIDDPNNPNQIILDISAQRSEKTRTLKAYHMDIATSLPLEEFEHITHTFFKALEIAGITPRFSEETVICDLFRRR